jgi:hypothetical protein
VQKKRRNFLIAGFVTSVVVVMNSGKIFSQVTPYTTLSTLQNDLFPQAKELGVNLSAYFTLIQQHSRIDEDEKEYLKNGIKWINEEAVEVYGMLYHELSKFKRQELLQSISQKKWGDNYLYTLLTYIMEATFSDPIYGVNPKRGGQKWLAFENGLPYPKEAYL